VIVRDKSALKYEQMKREKSQLKNQVEQLKINTDYHQ
jgi:hypothetical protein